ncbi:MAG: hypothetical protein JW915_01130 [Chitinispirillaceae bacterium]|nr:hypothetical protein [Chitinispirillaceae bacterium]
MLARIVLVFAMLSVLGLNAFAQTFPRIKLKVNNEHLLIFVGADPDPVSYTLGTKTAEYVMGYLANSIEKSWVEKKDVFYEAIPYTIALFSTDDIGGPYKIGFLRVDNADVIKFFDGGTEYTFVIKPTTSPVNVLKVDYVVGQIVKMLTSFYIDNTSPMPRQNFCVRNITVADGIPTNIEIIPGFDCP